MLCNIQTREAEYKVNLASSYVTNNFMGSFHKDINAGTEAHIINGSVRYANHFIGRLPIAFENNQELSVKREHYDYKSKYLHDWFFPEHNVKTHIVSRWESASIQQKIFVKLGPQQCVIGNLTALFYKDVFLSGSVIANVLSMDYGDVVPC